MTEKEVIRMAHIKGEEVKGVWIDGKLFHIGCLAEGDLAEIESDDLFVEAEMDDEDYYFCDGCGKQI
jgi:hypothetical protein